MYSPAKLRELTGANSLLSMMLMGIHSAEAVMAQAGVIGMGIGLDEENEQLVFLALRPARIYCHRAPIS